MTSYERYFRYRRPYQILIDDDFALNLHRAKLSPQKQFDMVMRSETKIMVTQCTMQALYSKGAAHQPIVDLAKSFERRKCNHKEAVPVHECIQSVVGETNKHRYVIATTNAQLRKHLHSIPGIPILHYNRMVIVLEPPSEATTERVRQIEGEKVSQSVVEKEVLDGKAKGDGSETEKNEQPKKKRKGPKGPNPLSAKKKKPDEKSQSQPQKHDKEDKETPKKKRSRRRNKSGGESGSASADAPVTTT